MGRMDYYELNGFIKVKNIGYLPIGKNLGLKND